jgi:hypothetical protein
MKWRTAEDEYCLRIKFCCVLRDNIIFIIINNIYYMFCLGFCLEFSLDNCIGFVPG